MAIYYNVAPRYTSGSPAQVDAHTARHVALQEQDAYRDHERRDTTTGLFGNPAIDLRGIVEERDERADCWLVHDLLTNAKFIRMFPTVGPEPSPEKHKAKAFKLSRKYNLPVEKD